ncbi:MULTISPECIES: PTS transporter subunit EIIC [Aerococcus]|uniref:PTS transporter subunit EIIC n=1 Tax=Aerococcus TaxID=1375 RepID=UPI000DCC5B84|nr:MULTISPECIES: PTS transporter subunit EIIC [Aerococcus]MDK6688150.1 PTS transporter subunit EIIC [Aerococcus urinae]MDK8132730.1 PTS transporter subunit EIIC [Aerococcus urinae]MDK8484350.1 PTS transporter subunit EIIC [Aerococcus urinae]MDL5179368.1 PTS transporter subunit EIIC [Aerococcus tenax]RAV92445.1 PTS sugar transporter subunit IIC [Aerococcus tenax]
MDYEKIGKQILHGVGGEENINKLTHCFTRLRFDLKELDQVDDKYLHQIESVISTVRSNGQLQVVIGSKVKKVYDVIQKQIIDPETQESQQTILNKVLALITQIFTPIVPAIAASGLIKGLLTAAKMISLTYFDIDISNHSTYILLFSISQIIFYFMSVFLAYTTATALKVDKYISVILGAFLVYPPFNEIMLDYSSNTFIFGLPVIKGAWGRGDSLKVFSYVESVIPIILTIIILYYVEQLLIKIIPDILKIILVPGLSLIIMLPIMLVFTGPLGIYLGNAIQWGYNSIINFSSILGGALIGGMWGVLVVFGAHRALLPIGLNDIALTGKQNLLAFAGAANFAQGGAVLGVALKTKNRELKSVSLSALVSAVLVGITEPAIYGANLRLKRPMISAVIAGAIGGAIMGFGNVYGDAFANNGILTIFTYAAFGLKTFLYYLAGCAVSFFCAALLTYILDFDETSIDNTLINNK